MSSSEEEKTTRPGGDIVINAENMNEFFFMDSDEEKQNYGASSKASMALSGSILKDTQQQKVSRVFIITHYRPINKNKLRILKLKFSISFRFTSKK